MSPDEILFLNGQFMPLAQGTISVEDRGFQFADGIYETIRIANGRLFRLDHHLSRLEESAAGIHLKLQYDCSAMAAVCQSLLERSHVRDGIIYIQITRGVSPRQHLPLDNALIPTTLAYTRSIQRFTPDQWQRGVTGWLRLDDRWAHCNLKTIALLANELGKLDARAHGADEVIFHGPDGTVHECGSANIFCIINGIVYTPPLTECILPGITRQVALEACNAINLSCIEQSLKTTDYLNADEVFLTSTTRNALPITAINNHTIGNGVFPLTYRINAAIESILDNETGT